MGMEEGIQNVQSPMIVHARSVMSGSLQPHGLSPARLLCSCDPPGKNTGMGCHALLQGTLLTQGLNPRLFRFPHRQVDSLPLGPLEKPMSLMSMWYQNKTRSKQSKGSVSEFTLTIC